MRVLISGAGIAGPSLAWFLAKAGARVTIVEKAPELLSHGQNVDIQGSARALIKKMGLLKEYKRLNTTETGTQFIDSNGRPFARFPVNRGKSISPTSEFEILRGDLAKILYAATKDNSAIDYVFGTTVEKVLENDEKRVKVQFSTGKVDQYDLLVAADGQWSRLRKQCFPADSVQVVDKGMFAVYWTAPRIPEDNNWWNIYQAPRSRVIAVRPDPHGTIRPMFAFMPRTKVQKDAWTAASRGSREVQQDLLRKEFADAGWHAERFLSTVDKAPDFYFQAIQQIRMSKWSNSRVVCLGDTAYAPTPLTGAGTSLAIVGAYVLAGEISTLKDGQYPQQALDAYEAKFRPFVEKTQYIPWFVPGIAHPDTLWKRWLFQSFVSLASRIAALPFLVDRFDAGNAEDFPLPRYPVFEDAADA